MQDVIQLGQVHQGSTLQPKRKLVDCMDFREPLSGDIAKDSCESVTRYRLQETAQWIETLHRGFLAPGERALLLSSFTCRTGAAKVASTTPQRGVAGACLKVSPK